MDSVPNHPTMLSDFIAECQTILSEEGDMPVIATAHYGRLTSSVEVNTLPNWYDGGWLDPDRPVEEGHAQRWTHARETKRHERALEIIADEPRRYLSREYCDSHTPAHYIPPEERDTVDGSPVGDL